jgi:hypothetical protein
MVECGATAAIASYTDRSLSIAGTFEDGGMQVVPINNYYVGMAG